MTTTKETEMATIHFSTGVSTVACGAKMRLVGDTGWDLGTTTIVLRKVTCAACLVVATGAAKNRAIAEGRARRAFWQDAAEQTLHEGGF